MTQSFQARHRPWLLGLVVPLLLSVPAAAERGPSLEAAVRGASLSGAPLELQVEVVGLSMDETLAVRILVDETLVHEVDLGPGAHSLSLPEAPLRPGRQTILLEAPATRVELDVRTLPGWLSIAPPLVAIGLALLLKDVLLSLFLGVFTGALLLFGWNPLTAFARSIDHFIVPSLANPDHAAIIVFTTLLGGMVGLITKNGGTRGIVERLSRFATNVRRGQLSTWAMGVLIFFDDYANTLIVGSTMRPITDRLKISREKLAYIVDSTAAPIASIVPISTWIGFEVGLIAGAFTHLGLPYDAYSTFLASIPYRFYPILALVLGFGIAWSGRDFGPMLKAERRAASTGKLIADGDTPLADYQTEATRPPADTPKRARNALIPVLTVIVVTVAGLFISGSAEVSWNEAESWGTWVRDVIGDANSYHALLWASLAGVTVALVLTLVQRLLSLRQAMTGLLEGFKAMLMALVVLVLAWSIGAVCNELHTAGYVVGLTEGLLSPYWVPVLVFVLSAVIAFATGTSWGTLAIMTPLVIPIIHGLAVAAGHAPGEGTYMTLLLGTIASVLTGAVWGDHCSPISDTTILSSMASGCDHIAHVRTQVPYALAAGLLAMALGDIPTAFGLSPWVSLVLGAAALVVLLRLLGRRSA